MSCNICIEKFNKSTRLEIICNYCNYNNCRDCFSKYLLETQDPYCMNCKKIFTNEFIIEKCTAVFYSTHYKKHREDILLNREKSLMPGTQIYVTLQKEKNNVREEIKILDTERSKLLLLLNKKQTEITFLHTKIHTMTIDNMFGGNTVSVEVEKERKKFIRKCPMNECRGFLSQQWKCGTCDTKICNNCNEEKEENHICEPGNVASMELLNKDTKPCPECGTMIFRISGCPQMFCTDCHCAWNWNTGLVEKGIIHNPHYYDFLRNGGNLNPGRNHGDIPCGGLPDVYTMRISFTRIRQFFPEIIITNLYSFHNCITHIQNHEIRNLTPVTEETTRAIRIQFMLHQIADDEFKKTLQQYEKDYNKRLDFNNIYQMFVDVSSDIFRQLIEYIRINKENVQKIFFDDNLLILTNLKEYFNDNLKKIAKNYKCVYPGIDDKFQFQYNYKTYLERKLRITQPILIPIPIPILP